MRRADLQQYVKLEDYEAAIETAYQDYRKQIEEHKIRIGEKIKATEAASVQDTGYEPPYIHCVVMNNTKEGAIKAANEHRIQLIAGNKWPLVSKYKSKSEDEVLREEASKAFQVPNGPYPGSGIVGGVATSGNYHAPPGRELS